jgi:mono/diheme cytochrome c family protein
MIWTAGLTAALMVGFTGGVICLAPKTVIEQTEVASTLGDQIVAGQDLYSFHCVECHGEDGKVTEITGVDGLEGKMLSAISGKDVLYTLNDAAMGEVIAYGRPDAGMTPFGRAYNSEGLSKSEIDYLVTFMRYTWDDRFEAPPIKPLFPALVEGEVPSYAVHIQPIVKRYCISCHRAGKTNNEYLMTTYEEILTTGDNKDHNVLVGDPEGYLLQVIQGTPIPDPDDPKAEMIRIMPPTSQLKPNIVDVFVRWIMAGMPQTPEEAAALSTMPTPGANGAVPPTATPTP